MPNAKNTDDRSEWAESLSDFGPDTQIYEGEQSRAALAELLDEAPAADEAAVTRRLRGRPSLSPDGDRGHVSRQIHTRIGANLSTLLDMHIQAKTARNESELVRAALSEYFDHHQVSI